MEKQRDEVAVQSQLLSWDPHAVEFIHRRAGWQAGQQPRTWSREGVPPRTCLVDDSRRSLDLYQLHGM